MSNGRVFLKCGSSYFADLELDVQSIIFQSNKGRLGFDSSCKSLAMVEEILENSWVLKSNYDISKNHEFRSIESYFVNKSFFSIYVVSPEDKWFEYFKKAQYSLILEKKEKLRAKLKGIKHSLTGSQIFFDGSRDCFEGQKRNDFRDLVLNCEGVYLIPSVFRGYGPYIISVSKNKDFVLQNLFNLSKKYEFEMVRVRETQEIPEW